MDPDINDVENTESFDAPAWFHEAIAVPRTSSVVRVGPTQIHYDVWDADPAQPKPGLLLIHGHAAHRHWWDFIAPAFMDRYRVVAMDTSGAGDSDHREVYRMLDFADEVTAVTNHAGLHHPVIVGHSFGGAIGRVACFLDSETVISGLICVDTAISRARPGNPGRQRNAGPGSHPPKSPGSIKPERQRFYTDPEQAVRRFRLRPPQPCENRYLLNYIARHSLRESKEGFSFKLDQRLFAKMAGGDQLPSAAEMVKALHCPVGYIYGEHSRFFNTPEALALLAELVPAANTRCIAGAYHHVFLDQPQRFIAALTSLLPSLNSRAG